MASQEEAVLQKLLQNPAYWGPLTHKNEGSSVQCLARLKQYVLHSFFFSYLCYAPSRLQASQNLSISYIADTTQSIDEIKLPV